MSAEYDPAHMTWATSEYVTGVLSFVSEKVRRAHTFSKHMAIPLGRALSVVLVLCAIHSQAAAAQEPERLAFVRHSQGSDGDEIYVTNSDGTDQKRLARFREINGFDWAPDGKRIAVGTSDGLWVMNADGGGMRRIIRLDGFALDDWAPDGHALALTRWGDDSSRTVFVVNIDGSGLRRVSPTKGVDDCYGPRGLRMEARSPSRAR